MQHARAMDEAAVLAAGARGGGLPPSMLLAPHNGRGRLIRALCVIAPAAS